MKLSSEQLKQLQEKLAAEKDPAEAAKIAKEYGVDVSAKDVEEILDQVSGGGRVISDDMLARISGGVSEDEYPQFQAIRDMYRLKGPNMAFITCVFYIPSPICYEIVQVIENEEGHNPPDGYR